MQRLTGRSYYAGIAQDTIAMAINDLDHGRRHAARRAGLLGRRRLDVVRRRAHAPRRSSPAGSAPATTAGVAWGGGETPALAGIVETGRIDLAAACTGIVNPKTRLSLGDALGPGDAIVLLASSGIHANGVSLARELAKRLPQGYLTPLPQSRGGIAYGDALLAPTMLYSPVTEALAAAGIAPHYCANITGHGWRKLLRHPATLPIASTRCPTCRRCCVHPRAGGPGATRAAYGTFNMGAGFALFVAADDAARALEVAQAQGVRAWHAGSVEAGRSELIIEPLGLVFSGNELQLR